MRNYTYVKKENQLAPYMAKQYLYAAIDIQGMSWYTIHKLAYHSAWSVKQLFA